MMKRALQLNGLAIIGVLICHAMYWTRVALADQVDTPTYWIWLFLQQLPLFAVPVFIFVSGYFFAFTFKGSMRPTLMVLRARIIKLVIPYLVWSFVMIVANVLWGQSQPVWKYLLELVSVGVHGPYFFVPLLLQLYVFVFLVSPLVVKYPWRSMLCAVFVQWGVIIVWYLNLWWPTPAFDLFQRLTPYWVFFRYLLYFVSGCVVFLKHAVVMKFVQRWQKALLAATIILVVCTVVGPELLCRIRGVDWRNSTLTISGNLYATVLILWFLSIRNFPARLSKPVQYLASRSYSIFLVHGPIMGIGARVLQRVIPDILAWPLVFGIVMFTFGLGGPLLLMKGVEISPLRSTYRSLFG